MTAEERSLKRKAKFSEGVISGQATAASTSTSTGGAAATSSSPAIPLAVSRKRGLPEEFGVAQKVMLIMYLNYITRYSV